MGIGAVKIVHSAEWARLSDPARLVLCAMAVSVLDQPRDGKAARRYWAGHDSLILGLTGSSPGEPGYEAGKKKVSRAIRELIAAGAVTRTRAGGRGRQAEYVILPGLDAAASPLSNNT